MKNRVKIRFFGTFAVIDSSGNDVTPKGKKARGIVALLAETATMRRGRRWLEAMLWSDRAPSQASGSLRQSLSELRSAFGDNVDILSSDRGDVWLDVDAVDTDIDPGSPLREPGRSFLEGFDIRDEAFEQWLAEARSRYDGAAPVAAAPTAAKPLQNVVTIRSAVSEIGSVAENVVGRVLADTVARGIEQNFSAARYVSASRNDPDLRPDLEIRCDTANDGGRAVAFIRVEEGASGRVLFSEHLTVPGSSADLLQSDAIHGIVNAASAQVPARLASHIDLHRPEAAAMGFSSLARRQLKRLDGEGLAEANENFQRAYEVDSNGVFLAWRAFVRMAQLVEAVDGDAQGWRDEVDQLASDALNQSGGNSLAVALVALTRFMLEDDLRPAAELAKTALSQNTNSLFARQTLALAHSAVGDAEKAYAMSSSCRTAAANDELSHLWDLYHSLVCIGAGRLDEARATSDSSAAKSPTFIAPRRQLVALCAHSGDFDDAKAHLTALEKLEGGFTIDRYLNDPDYPNLTLRNAGLLDPVRKIKD
ncbi:hypothetical protein [Gymnodinialimonas hymeniacidonis]|uniref:AfsR/SARP family transcriptional regulator n=1 Tax=Gymnodinialimonas hymeniacidonis TaxID=3126508 RepID=UPI0034C68E04